MSAQSTVDLLFNAFAVTSLTQGMYNPRLFPLPPTVPAIVLPSAAVCLLLLPSTVVRRAVAAAARQASLPVASSPRLASPPRRVLVGCACACGISRLPSSPWCFCCRWTSLEGRRRFCRRSAHAREVSAGEPVGTFTCRLRVRAPGLSPASWTGCAER